MRSSKSALPLLLLPILALFSCASAPRELPPEHPANPSAASATPSTFATDLSPAPLAWNDAAPAPAHVPAHGAAAPAASGPQFTPKPGAPYFTCPMHPEIVRDALGDCPLCGMKLVRKIAPKGGAK